MRGFIRACDRRVSLVAAALLAAITLAGCVDESPTPVVFDQLLESATFENRLLSPVVILRDGVPLDTLEARRTGLYPIGRKGAIRHAWRIMAPLDNNGNPAGEEPYQDLGVQYRVRASYVIDNEALDDGTLFTPRVVNLRPYTLRITANYAEEHQFSTDYRIRPNQNIPDLGSPAPHAPYYYWHSSSNLRLTETSFGRVYEIHRDDTTAYGTLRLDNGSLYDGAGLTEPIVIDD